MNSFQRLLAAALWLAVGSTAANGAAALQFNRDVRPILAENCYGCHGADSAARKAGLRLDHFDDAILPRKDSSPAIVPGKPEASSLFKRVQSADPEEVMPPAKTHKTLTAEQKEVLKTWIASGAKYQPHWSFIAPQRSALPKVRNQRWARNPIDSFILARLEQEGLQPSPEADRRTLARRLSLDLTGLPPRPEEVEAFVKDSSPDAYEKLVDRWMASPRWGEHRARYWLDGARYADSNGLHFDNYRQMWPYRDWVINAFNRNEPFDQFTIEQLAGDLLPNATLDQQVASGFNRCHVTSNEGGTIEEEYLVLYTRDRTEATSQVWLGLTAGCGVCHDHKYDPLPQKEFYSLAAFFNNTTQRAMDGNIKDTPPVVVIPVEADRARWEKIQGEICAAKQRVDARREAGRKDFAAWLGAATPAVFSQRLPADKPLLHALLGEEQQQSLKLEVRGETREIALPAAAAWQEGVLAAKAFTTGSKHTPVLPEVGDFDKEQKFSYGAWVYPTDSRDGALLARMDDAHDYRGWDLWLEGGKPGAHLISKWPDDALKVVSKKAIESRRWTHVCVTYDGSMKAGGVKIYLDGREESLTVQADKLKNSTRTEVPLKLGQRNGSSPVEKAGLQDVRIYERTLQPAEVKSLARDSRLARVLARAPADRTDKEKEDLYQDWLANVDQEFEQASTAAEALRQEEAAIKSRGSAAQVMHERDEAAQAFVLFRGEYDKRRDKVQPGTPAALPPMPPDFPRNRLGFARWLLLPEHPLTARVTVNRFWQEIFGTGIVKTAGDFGTTGELPSHQELLDWMAVEFRESGWDMKKFFRLLVTSATYRQAATVTPDRLAKDPANRLLSRGPRFRMDAEMVRDYALSASGLLVEKTGGPSVKPYQPEGVWEAVAMPESNLHFYKQDSGEALYRRSLYTFWKRAAPPALMDIFNAPSRENCTVRRERTDTPLQALATLNDPQFVEAARHLAQLALKDTCGTKCSPVDFMARRLLARPLRPEETRIIEADLAGLLAQYRAEPKEAAELLAVGESKADPSLDVPTLAACTMLANEMMNLDEVLNK